MPEAKSSRIGREWVDGNYPKGFEVLDVGAGSTPAPGVTRAVDEAKPKRVRASCPDRLKEYVAASAEKLPYPDEFFDRGVSRWAIGPRIRGIPAIRELYRVLKPEGVIYISILYKDGKYLPVVTHNLVTVGFKILGVLIGVYSQTGRKRTKEYVVHAVKQGRE